MNCANDTEAERWRATVTGLRLDLDGRRSRASPVTSLTGALPLLTRPAVTVMRSWPEKVARANATDGTDRFDVSGLATDTGVQTVPSGKLHVLGAAPAGLLEVADEHRFPALERRRAQDAFGQLQRRTVARRAGADLGGVDRRVEARADPRWRACSPRRSWRTARASRLSSPPSPSIALRAASRARCQ